MKVVESKRGKDVADLELLITEITTDAYGDDEQLRAFLQALQDGVALPSDAFVIGEPVTVVAFDYDGNQRRGLVARCRREDSSEHVVAVSELVLAPRWSGNHFLAAYHKWLGLDPLDAHAHLGNFVFEHRPNAAIRYYEVGVRIGELSLSPNFNGLLPWGHMDNRPFLRCLHGYGLCLWRLSRFEEAERVFDRMLWLNPTDNQGVRFLIDDVRARTAWEDRREER